jgi:hypothetical protein
MGFNDAVRRSYAEVVTKAKELAAIDAGRC